MKKAGILTILLILVSVNAQTIQNSYIWKTYTCKNEVFKFVIDQRQIWCATAGGIFSVDLETASIEEYTNTEGLLGNYVASVSMDINSNIWFSFKNKGLNLFDKSGWSERIIDITGELNINDIAVSENIIYIANDKGISEYLIDKDEIRSNFKNLGNFTPSIPVTNIYIIEDTLWAVTGEGIVSAYVNSPNLQDPVFWTNHTEVPGKITGLTKFKGSIFIGSSEGVYKYEDNIPLKIADKKPVHFIGSNENQLFVAVWSSLYCGESIEHLNRSGFDCFKINFAEIHSDTIIVATSDKGIILRISDNTINYKPNGPGGNSFGDFALEEGGKLWCSPGVKGNKGLYTFHEGVWVNYSSDDLLGIGNFYDVEVDNFNRKWAGTPGNGLLIIDDRNGFEITHYDHTDGKLAGSDTPTFVIVGKILKDKYGNIWFINNYANNGKPLICATQDDSLYRFSTSDGLYVNELNTLIFDDDNRIWIGTGPRGICVLDYNGTLNDKSDDNWMYFGNFSGNEYLRSNSISALDLGLDGTIWIGTPEGINYYSLNSIGTLICPLSNEIHSFAVDGFDNLWVGTEKGIAVFNFRQYDWNTYTTENSPLVDNNIVSIFIDKKTGRIFIGTGYGMSLIETPFKTPDPDYSNIEIFPNPFVLNIHEKVTIKNLTSFSSVSVFTETGKLIRKMMYDSGFVTGTEAYWDGRDKNGEQVPSGIYIIAVSDELGNKKPFKIAVVR